MLRRYKDTTVAETNGNINVSWKLAQRSNESQSVEGGMQHCKDLRKLIMNVPHTGSLRVIERASVHSYHICLLRVIYVSLLPFGFFGSKERKKTSIDFLICQNQRLMTLFQLKAVNNDMKSYVLSVHNLTW